MPVFNLINKWEASVRLYALNVIIDKRLLQIRNCNAIQQPVELLTVVAVYWRIEGRQWGLVPQPPKN